MVVASTKLTEIGERFLASMNARDYATAAAMYAPGAVYESPALVGGEHDGRIVGRDQIMRFFEAALDGEEEFRLHPLDVFAGLNMVVVISSTLGRAFVDVLRTDDTGLIVEHLEVAAKPSPLDFLAGSSSA